MTSIQGFMKTPCFITKMLVVHDDIHYVSIQIVVFFRAILKTEDPYTSSSRDKFEKEINTVVYVVT